MKQFKIGIISAMIKCAKYKKASDGEREALRQNRLRDVVSWAKEKSPYYASLYKDIPSEWSLSDLPPVTKVELMKHWDEWVTDRDISLDKVHAFMQNIDNIGRKIDKKYYVFTTSGSTGNPLVAICDNTTNSVMGAMSTVRSFARKQDMSNFIKRGAKTIGVFATGGFYLGNSSVRSRLLKMPWKKRQMAVTSALLPIGKIVEELNAFQPAMLGGYPSNLELLMEKQRNGELHISPVLIMTGGEYLSDKLRQELSEAFNCYVQTSYSCTEGGTIACECSESHFHVNDDWIIVEPVDKDNNPVPFGVQADKILITNLYNYTQPFIRYEVTDRVVMHNEPCPCGNRSPWLTLEGRTDDVVTFAQNGKEIKLAPLAIYAVLKEVHELRRFQFIALDENSAELRIDAVEQMAKDDAFAKAEVALQKHFAEHGLTNVQISLSADSPKQDEGSGKFKHIIQTRTNH